MGRLSSTSSGGRLKLPKLDIGTTEGLASYARSRGFEREAEQALERPKLSTLQRVGRFLNAFEVGNAVYQNRYEKASLLKTYTSDIGKEVKAGITGHETRLTPKKTFKDILTQEGFKDRPGKIDAVDVVGLVADIVTDPTTWFGSAIGKQVAKGTKAGLRVAEKAPVAGKIVKGFREAGEDLFKPFAKIERQLGDKGTEYVSTFQKYVKGTRAEVDDF